MPPVAGLIMLSKASPFLKSILRGVFGLLDQKGVQRLVPFMGGSGAEYLNHWTEALLDYRREFDKAMNDHALDALICPPCALPAFMHNTADKLGLCGVYTALFNVTGYPAGIVPVSTVRPDEAVGRKTTADISIKTAAKIEQNSAGLPLAVQIAAKHWDEHIVLAVMKALKP